VLNELLNIAPITHLLVGRAELDPSDELGEAVRMELPELLDAAVEEGLDQALLVVLAPGVVG
jgi:hypothetical protein